MFRSAFRVLLASSVLATPATSAPRVPAPASNPRAEAPAPAPAAPAQRELRRRPLRLTDAEATSVPEVLVAPGVPTTLTFRPAIKPESVLLADTSGVFPEKTRATATAVLLTPRGELPPGAVATLQVTTVDGTILPFLLRSDAKLADLQVDVEVALEEKAAPQSPQAMKGIVEQLQEQLDQCQSGAPLAGAKRIASLILEQDTAHPQPFERLDIHRRDKQSRLLVTAQRAYRLLGHTFIVVSVQNRDLSPWVLDKVSIATSANGQLEEMGQSFFTADLTTLAPDQEGKVIVGFPSPRPAPGQRFTLTLTGRSGNRNVRLEDISL